MFPRVDVFYYLAGLVVAFTINGLVYTGGLNNIAIFMLYNQEKIVAEYPAEHVSRFLIATFCFICVAFIGENFWHQSRKEMLRENLERMRQANTDPLTKLPAMQDPGAHFPLSAVVVDIDHFKTINDTYGHDIGDEVLIHITRLMREAVRTTDVVARTGGAQALV